MPGVSVNECLKEAIKMELRDTGFQTLSTMSILIPSGVLVTATFFIPNDEFLKL